MMVQHRVEVLGVMHHDCGEFSMVWAQLKEEHITVAVNATVEFLETQKVCKATMKKPEAAVVE